MEHGRIPNNLKRYRRIAGLSQKKVAAVLGLQHTNCISRWEKGLCLPGSESLFRLSLLYRTLPTNLYLDFWQYLQHDADTRAQKLLPQDEPCSSSETYFV